jgi:hypothetical protein
MKYLGVSLLVREAVYPESLPDPTGTKLLVKAPSQPYHEVPWSESPCLVGSLPYHEIPWCESPCSGGSLPRIPP